MIGKGRSQYGGRHPRRARLEPVGSSGAVVAEEPVATGKHGIRREVAAPRPVGQTASRGFLEGHDPGKHYVWVSEVNDPTINVAYYKSRGYKISQYDPTDARP